MSSEVQEEGAVIQTLLADLPLLRHAQTVVFQGLSRQGRNGENDNLGGILAGEGSQRGFQLLHGCR